MHTLIVITTADRGDPHIVAFHQDLHCLLIKNIFRGKTAILFRN